jgi:hypothetical protein
LSDHLSFGVGMQAKLVTVTSQRLDIRSGQFLPARTPITGLRL